MSCVYILNFETLFRIITQLFRKEKLNSVDSLAKLSIKYRLNDFKEYINASDNHVNSNEIIPIKIPVRDISEARADNPRTRHKY